MAGTRDPFDPPSCYCMHSVIVHVKLVKEACGRHSDPSLRCCSTPPPRLLPCGHLDVERVKRARLWLLCTTRLADTIVLVDLFPIAALGHVPPWRWSERYARSRDAVGRCQRPLHIVAPSQAPASEPPFNVCWWMGVSLGNLAGSE